MSSMIRTVWFTAILSIFWVLALGGSVQASALYTLTDLGALPGDQHSYAMGINNLGEVVGFSTGESGSRTRPFIYRESQMSVVSGVSRTAYDINKHGTIVGGTSRGINDQGQTVGYGTIRNGEDSIQIGKPGVYVNTWDINNREQVVGGYAAASGHVQPFLYHEGEFIGLGLLPGMLGAEAHAINDEGVIVGGPTHGYSNAFLYRDGRMIDIGTLGGDGSSAFGINARGDVVGWSYLAGNEAQHAFLLTNGSMLDLNELLPPETTWTVQTAFDVNDVGQIVGYAWRDGVNHAVLLTPISVSVPEPGAASLLAISVVFYLIRRILHNGTINTRTIHPEDLHHESVFLEAGSKPHHSWGRST